MPVEARGLFSGILQQGYALGYLIAAGFNMDLVPKSKHSFKLLFYLGAGLTLAVALARLPFPESKQFLERKKNAEAISGKEKIRSFTREGKAVMKQYWKRTLYAIIMMALFNYCSHTSQDMYVSSRLISQDMMVDGADYHSGTQPTCSKPKASPRATPQRPP